MAQQKQRNKYWKLSNGYWMPRIGTENIQQAYARYAANPSLATSARPSGLLKDGGLDVCTQDQIRGWGINPDSDTASTYVDVWIGGVVVDSVLANQPRSDVADYYGIVGFDKFGFTYNVPSQYRTLGIEVRVTLKDRTDDVENSPKQMQAGTTTTTTTTATTTTGTGTTTTTTGTTTTTTGTTTTLQATSLDAAVGPKPVYLGQIDWTYSDQSDTNFLDLEVAEVNSEGLIRLRNKAPGKVPTNGRSLKYHIGTNKYVDDIDGRWFEPFQGLLVEMFWADTSVPDYAWQAEGQPYSEFFKAVSLIHFK